MGYAPCAWNESVREDVTLLYMDITWAELEPVEGKFAWNAIDAENQVARWQAEGKHMVLRFVCDIPGNSRHMDIPRWLYEKTGHAGKWYDTAFGKGFSPDYSNEQFLVAHKKAVKALGNTMESLIWLVMWNLEALDIGGMACSLLYRYQAAAIKNCKRAVCSSMAGSFPKSKTSYEKTLFDSKKTMHEIYIMI